MYITLLLWNVSIISTINHFEPSVQWQILLAKANVIFLLIISALDASEILFFSLNHKYYHFPSQVISKVMEVYKPNAVVLQCGADSLAGDRLGCFNLSLKGTNYIFIETVYYFIIFNVKLRKLWTPETFLECSLTGNSINNNSSRKLCQSLITRQFPLKYCSPLCHCCPPSPTFHP